MTGVDATKVHQHPVLKHKKFDKIIFNFPHTGGKMKIHQNRELLRQFFLSAVNIMAEGNGRIVVSLCDGQGADYVGKRNWADTWQIVEMAGHADLLLVECSPFQWENFPLYSNVGYRSLEKGFHSENAMVHIFSAVKKTLYDFAHKSLEYHHQAVNNEPILNPFEIRMLRRNILEDIASPASFVLKNLEHCASLESNNICPIVMNKVISKSCLLDEVVAAVSLWHQNKTDCLLYSFYKLNVHPMEMCAPPLTSQTLIVGHLSCKIFTETIQGFLMKSHLCHYKLVEKDCSCNSKYLKKFYLESSNDLKITAVAKLLKSSQKCAHQSVIIVHVDSISLKIFSLESWRQLWSENVYVFECSGNPRVSGICMYPVQYTFDMSFTIDERFSEAKLFRVLQDIAGEIVVSAVKLSEFCSPGNKELSLCFRLTYLSYDVPMCRKAVIDFHQNALGRKFETMLGVRLK